MIAKKSFSELNKKTQIAMSTSPHCVYVTVNPDDESYDQIVERQEKFLKLSETIQNKLLSREVSKKIQKIGERYNLSLIQLASIARIIRSYYFREIETNKFANILSKEMKIDLSIAQEISRYVIEAIINIDLEASNLNSKVKLSFNQALERYPKINEQVLSGKMIKFSGRPYPVKGTVENWIKDYYNSVGAGNRDIMKRSRYLYNGENTKILDDEEKQKLAFLLKALEENSLVTIDPERNEIIFEIKKNIQRKTLSSLRKNNFLVNEKTPTSDNRIKPFEGIKREVNNGRQKKERKSFQYGGRESDVEKRNNLTELQDAVKKNGVSSAGVRSVKHHPIKPKITHIQGNGWNLKSDQFGKSAKDVAKKRSIVEKIFKKNSKKSKGDSNPFEAKNTINTADDFYPKKNINNRIKFSSPQQFPVEKNKSFRPENKYLPKFNETKVSGKRSIQSKNDFFGKISPIDD